MAAGSIGKAKGSLVQARSDMASQPRMISADVHRKRPANTSDRRCGIAVRWRLLEQRRQDEVRRLGVNERVQLLGGLEVGDAFRRYVHLLAGLRVAAPARPAASDTKTAEAAEFDLLTLVHRLCIGAEHDVDDDSGAPVREASAVEHLLHERRFRQAAVGDGLVLSSGLGLVSRR